MSHRNFSEFIMKLEARRDELEDIVREFLIQPHSCVALSVTAVTLDNCPICTVKRRAEKILNHDRK